MKTLERRYSKTDRIIAKAKCSSAIYLRTVVLAVILGGIIGVLWGLGDKVEKLIFKHDTVMYFTDSIMKWVLVGAAAFVLFHFLMQAISVYKKELIVTEDKIVMRYGVFAVKNITVPLDKVITIETKQRLLQRIFDYGAIIIYADGILGDNVMKGVKSVDRLSMRILKQVEDAKKQAENKRIQLQLSHFTKPRK